ncbi:MAG TPA: hypothetical protein V6C89_20220 [Drouetiella sp.]|jgi:tetratricopeptide (TPR) repeat protein
MFTFSEQEYKWCPECSGNIRSSAFYCRYCRKPVGSKILSAQTPRNAILVITGAAYWLPKFLEILNNLPEQFRQRIEAADGYSARLFIENSEGINAGDHTNERNIDASHSNPPVATELGLIWDLLISLYANQVPLATICADERVQLLELTVGEIIAEYELRVTEIKNGTACSRCAEFVDIDADERCRFCTGSQTEIPEPSDVLMPNISRFDASLLRNILLWESATRRINDEEKLDEKFMTRYAITDSDIDHQILKLKQHPQTMPKSRWREHIEQLGIEPRRILNFDSEYFCLQDVTALVRALTPSFLNANKNTDQELAMIVVDHALNRWQNSRHFKEERGSLLSAKSCVYSSMKDTENAEKFKMDATAERATTLPEGSRNMSSLADRIRARLNQEKADPEEKLKELEEQQKELQKRTSESAERMESLIPGFGEIFKNIGERSSKIAQIEKHSLQGEAALQKADPAQACVEFEAAIALLDDNVSSVTRRCGLLISLAEAQTKNGQPQCAEATYKRAIGDANDLEEAHELTHMSRVHHNYACFLSELGKHVESEKHFKIAAVKHAELVKQYHQKGFSISAPLENWQIKRDYAALLHAMGRTEEAKQMEIESLELKEKHSDS